MHSHRDGTFRSRFGLWIFLLGLLGLLGLLAFGCSTPSATRVEDDQGGKGVLESIETVVTPEKTTIVIHAPGARTDRKTYTLSDPPRICVDLEATPADDLPETVELPEGPVEKYLIQDRGPGHTGVVVYVRPEKYKQKYKYKHHLTREGDKVLLAVTVVGDEKFEASNVTETRPGDAAGSGISELAVLERPGGGTRLRIETDQPVESAVTFEGSVLSIDLQDVAATPRGLKALEATPPGGVIQGVRAFYAPRDRSVLLKISLRALVPYHINREGNLLIVDFDALPGGFSQPVPPARRTGAKQAVRNHNNGQTGSNAARRLFQSSRCGKSVQTGGNPGRTL